MGYARYVGRVGALAVALGIGAAVATAQGVAWADTETETTAPAGETTETGGATSDATTQTDPATGVATGTDAGSPSPDPATPDKKADPEPTSPTQHTEEVAPGVVISHSGVDLSGNADEPDKDSTGPSTAAAKSPPMVAAESRNSQSRTAVSPSNPVTVKPTANVSAQTAASSPSTASTPARASTAPATTNPQSPPPLLAVSIAVARVVQVAVATPVSAAAQVFAAVAAAVLGNGPNGPVDSPAHWVLAAAARREIGQAATARQAAAAPAAQTFTSQSVTATTPNLPPVIGAPTLGTADPTTGAVTGQVNAADPEGKKPTFALTAGPQTGSVVFNKTTGAFTYTPTAAQRVLAGLTPVADAEFTVTVSDGTNKVPTTVAVPIAPTPVHSLDAVSTPHPPFAVAATDRRAYVANTSANSVTVIDTLDGAVVTTIPVGNNPTAVAVKPDGSKVYVANLGSNTVSVIDASNNTVKVPIAIGFAPSALAISPNGKTLYVGNTAGDLVKVGTTTDKVTGRVANTGDATSIVVSPDGKKVYTTNANGIAVFSSTSTTAKAIGVEGDSPRVLAVGRDNTKLYVVTGDNTVKVLETKTYAALNEFDLDSLVFNAGNPVEAGTVNKDGSLLLVAAQDGTLSVIDTATRTQLTTLATGDSAEGLAASPDGMQLYLADGDGGALRVVSLVPPNIRPVVDEPIGDADQTTGVITGTTGVTDADDDPLKITITSAPGKGKVSITSDGGFTYTPTAAARHTAASDAATLTDLIDTFAFTADDGRRGIVQHTITVPVIPANAVPTVKTSVGTANSSTGAISGSVTATDKDRDRIIYDGTITTSKGTVVVSAAGKFTYTPTVSARHAAAMSDPSAKTDTFSITVDDGHGGVIAVPVTVTIRPRNNAPASAAATDLVTNSTTGRVTGRITAVDANGDTLSFVAPASTTKGAVVVNADGTFTYTPTAAARSAAGAADATTAAKTDSFTVTVLDGHGGTGALTVKVTVVGSAVGNQIPVAAPTPYETSLNASTGMVTGHVNVTDTSALTYALHSSVAPNIGSVIVDTNTGAFTFTPTARARYHAWYTPGPDVVVLTVSALDGQDGTPVDVIATISARHPDEDGSLALAELRDLVANGDVDVHTNPGGTIRAIDGAFTASTVSDAAAAAQALNKVATLLGAPAGFANAQNITVQTVEHSGAGTEVFYRVGQKINGITVLGSEVVLATDGDGKVTGVFSNYHSAITSVNTTPASTINQEAEAVAHAEDEILSGLADQDQATVDAFLASLTFDSDLVVYDLDANNAPTLAWRVKVLTTPTGPTPEPGDELGSGFPSVGTTYFIYANGAKTGQVIVQFAAAQHAVAPLRTAGNDLRGAKRTMNATNTGTKLVLSDLTRNVTTYATAYDDVHWIGEPIIPGRIVNYSGSWDSAAVTAQANTARVYDYYATVLGRDSFDDQHGDIVISIRYNPSGESATGWKNAAWDGNQILFGDAGNNELALDLVGHEYTHAVIQYVNELAYLGESGALNESYADIMGALIENKTGDNRWLFAEDAAGDPYRSMKDPSKYNQPENYDDRYVDPCGCNDNDDFDGVHRNSGIFSFAAYKMMEATKAEISGERWAHVFYDSLYRLPSTARFVDARYAVISSARANGFTPAQMNVIKAAFDAVGVDAQDLV